MAGDRLAPASRPTRSRAALRRTAPARPRPPPAAGRRRRTPRRSHCRDGPSAPARPSASGAKRAAPVAYPARAIRRPSGDQAAALIGSRGCVLSSILGVTSFVGSGAAPVGLFAPASIQALISAISGGLGGVVAFRRHDRLGAAFHQQHQPALLAPARHDGRTAAPAGQQLVVALQHQLAFGILRVVAARAVLDEDRQDVGVVIRRRGSSARTDVGRQNPEASTKNGNIRSIGKPTAISGTRFLVEARSPAGAREVRRTDCSSASPQAYRDNTGQRLPVEGRRRRRRGRPRPDTRQPW